MIEKLELIHSDKQQPLQFFGSITMIEKQYPELLALSEIAPKINEPLKLKEVKVSLNTLEYTNLLKFIEPTILIIVCNQYIND